MSVVARSNGGSAMTLWAQSSRYLARKNVRFFLAVAIAVLMGFGLADARAADQQLSGPARVADGDTIRLNARYIRLDGIDAPEPDQVCLDSQGELWTCGIAARDKLSSRIIGRVVLCLGHGEDGLGRLLASCSVGGQSLSAFMVKEGLALDYTKYSRHYVDEEMIAREKRIGMWSGAFIAPWDWRLRNKSTVILGALSVPVTARAQLLAPASAITAPSPECTIKGNVDRKGERIYHMPAQMNYRKISMQDPKKRWFCSEDEAHAAGWRPARK